MKKRLPEEPKENSQIKALRFVVMGEPFETAWSETAMVFVVRWHVLNATGNIGRAPSEFELRDCTGQFIEPTTRVGDLPEGEIFLSPALGAGGSHRNYRRRWVPPIMNGRERGRGGPPLASFKLWFTHPTMNGRNGTRWNLHAHAKTQKTDRRLEARSERRAGRVELRVTQEWD